ncbi:MAG: GNAT family protein [Polyangiaceae bacterium]
MVPVPPTYEVRLARPSDAPMFARHIVRHLAESGEHGEPHFAPMSDVDAVHVEESSERRWRTEIGRVGWGRAWLVMRGRATGVSPDEPLRVVGHAELRGPHVEAGLHRAEFSIGLERAARGMGIGRALAEAVLDWARSETELVWIDLRVFASNTPARALYQKLGFRELGTIPDALRAADGAAVDDVLMTISLERAPSAEV